MTSIWSCALQNWQFGIDDPGVMGWLTAALYAATCGLALYIAARGVSAGRTAGRERLFWYMLGLIMLLLAVNKQLDLQTLLTTIARCIAQIQGWCDTRRSVQIGFIAVVLVVALIVLGIMSAVLRGTLRRDGLALVGLVFVLGFVAIRAAGFHHMDQLTNIRFEMIRMNWILEITGPILIVICGVLILRAART